jgi:GTP-binding protein EngB required for normal cell division/uncharacterized protein (DUF697 family)
MGKLKEELQTILEKMPPPNVVVLGRNGAGKSTLINKVFGAELAKTGTGLPVNTTFTRYPESLEEKPLVVVYDSMGFEMDKGYSYRDEIVKFIKEKKLKGIDEQIHLVWYVINVGMKRFEHFDAAIISLIRSERVPVIVVFSQADLARPDQIAKMEETIRNYRSEFNLDQLKIVKVAADPIIGEPFGVTELVNLSSELLPDLYVEALVARQVIDLELKRKLASKYIKLSAAACFANGFVPLPGATSANAIVTQTTLCTKIASLYGYGEWVEVLDKVGGLTVASIVTVGITWFLDLFNTIIPPGIIVAGGLKGGVAATYISIVGATYTSVFEKLSLKNINGATKTEIEEFIKVTFREEFRKNSKFSIGKPRDLNKIDKLVEGIS